MAAVARPQAAVRIPAAKTVLVAAELADTQLVAAMHQGEAHRAAARQVAAAATTLAAAGQAGRPLAAAMHRAAAHRAAAHRVAAVATALAAAGQAGGPLAVAMHRAAAHRAAVVATALAVGVERPTREVHLVARAARRAPVARRGLVDRAVARVVLQPAALPAAAATALVAGEERPVREVHLVARAGRRVPVDRAEVWVVLQVGAPPARAAEPEHVPLPLTLARRRTAA